ncbi:hypothetical protein JCM10212_005488 [Sporobolomyces blumeae]
MASYEGKSDKEIIEGSAVDLNLSKDKDFDPTRSVAKRTALGDDTGVNESGLDKFPGASVETGRTGQTGGGTNPMNIAPEHGGSERTNGTSSDAFENVPAGEDKASYEAKTNPGGINVSGKSQEALRTTDAPEDGKPNLGEQVRNLNPSSALLGASIFTLVVFAPSGFYEVIQLIFHYDTIDHQALSIVSVVVAVGATLLAILGLVARWTKSDNLLANSWRLGSVWTAFSIAMTVWTIVIAVQAYDETESKITAAGTERRTMCCGRTNPRTGALVSSICVLIFSTLYGIYELLGLIFLFSFDLLGWFSLLTGILSVVSAILVLVGRSRDDPSALAWGFICTSLEASSSRETAFFTFFRIFGLYFFFVLLPLSWLAYECRELAVLEIHEQDSPAISTRAAFDLEMDTEVRRALSRGDPASDDEDEGVRMKTLRKARTTRRRSRRRRSIVDSSEGSDALR